MAISRLRDGFRAAALIALVLTAGAAKVRAQTAAVTGRVTDQATGRPVDQARVVVTGSPFGARTNSEGTYLVRGLPPGAVRVRVLRVGYTEVKKEVTLQAGETATLDFAITVVPTSLEPVITTATARRAASKSATPSPTSRRRKSCRHRRSETSMIS